MCVSNFDLSSTLFARTRRLFCPLFQKWLSTSSGACRVGKSAFLFHSFSLRLFCERKAAKESWYEYLVPLTMATAYRLSTFSLKPEAQRKSSQKEMPIIAQAAGLPLLKKRSKTAHWFVLTMCKHTDKSQFTEER